MNNFRLILLFSLAVVLLMIYKAWLVDYGSRQENPQTQSSQNIENGATMGNIPKPAQNTGAPSNTADIAEIGTIPGGDVSRETIQVSTDTLQVAIDTQGGTISSLFLRDYPVNPDFPDIKVHLLRSEPPDFFISQSGLLSSKENQLPTHKALYRSEKKLYQLQDGDDLLEVKLYWTNELGKVDVVKIFRFYRGSYLVDIEHRIQNSGSEPIAARQYQQLIRSTPSDSGQSAFIYTYTGGAYYTPDEKYQKISFDKMEDGDLQRPSPTGWIAMIQHYFLGAWIPNQNFTQHYYSKVLGNGRYMLGTYSDEITVAAEASEGLQTSFYGGPKLQATLEEITEGLELTVDYGWLTFLAKPLFWLLDKFHSLVGNWGWAIILLTLLIKVSFYKLSEASYRSMANMRKLTPRLQALKDRYGDDRERLNQAMMEMYKKEKINPLGGCLPMLVQIPVFIALYWVLLESVEMRQAPFILWIDNLSAADPYFILPLIMGVSMFVQQKLNPAPIDPIQAKVMMSLPFVFTVFFAFFPSGLVLYWVVNNLLSIAQQWLITKRMDQAGH